MDTLRFINISSSITSIKKIPLLREKLEQLKSEKCVPYFVDALYEFYYSVFPLLKELQLKAILGVAPRYILDQSTLAPATRRSVPYALTMQDGFFEEKAPFCTWQELKEMQQSGFIKIASHSFSKMNLSFPFVNLEREIVLSKKIIEAKLSHGIDTFIYPFGKKNKKAEKLVLKNYLYTIERITDFSAS